ncbi:MAG TPA: DNA polymerase, partial [Armatimonadota bacterium]
PIQGTAADIVKLAMIRVSQRLKESGFSSKLILQVHDELVFDAPANEVDSLIPLVRDAMEGAYVLEVPLKVDVKTGLDWCTAQPVSAEEQAEV